MNKTLIVVMSLALTDLLKCHLEGAGVELTPERKEALEGEVRAILELPRKQPATVEDEIYFVKGLRQDLDSVHKDLKRGPASREKSLAITKLQEARMWLGEDLGRINEQFPEQARNPYPNGNDPTSAKIDPPADQAE